MTHDDVLCCFRNAAGRLPADLPCVHVHSRPLSGAAGTISLQHANPTHKPFTLYFLVCCLLDHIFTYSSVRCRGQEEGKDALFRKRKVLRLVSHWSRLYKDFLKEEEHVRSFMKVAVSFNSCLSMGFYLHTIILILRCPFL